MSISNIEKMVKVLAVIAVGIVLSEIIGGEINIFIMCMKLIGAGSMIYTLICILKDKKHKEQETHMYVEYNMMILISGIVFLLASVMEYKTIFNIIPIFWIIVITIAVVKLWKGAV